MEAVWNAAGFRVFVIKVFLLAMQRVGKQAGVNSAGNQWLNITVTSTTGEAQER